jgi:hypothetical protein
MAGRISSSSSRCGVYYAKVGLWEVAAAATASA